MPANVLDAPVGPELNSSRFDFEALVLLVVFQIGSFCLSYRTRDALKYFDFFSCTNPQTKVDSSPTTSSRLLGNFLPSVHSQRLIVCEPAFMNCIVFATVINRAVCTITLCIMPTHFRLLSCSCSMNWQCLNIRRHLLKSALDLV